MLSCVMEWILVIMMLLFLKDVSTKAFTVPIENLFSKGTEDLDKMKRMPYNEVNSVENNDVGNDGDLEAISHLKHDSIHEEGDEINWDFQIANLLSTAGENLEDNLTHPTTNPAKNEVLTASIQEAKNKSRILSRLLQDVIIDRNSIFRVQFYNSDYEERNNSSLSAPTDENNDTSVPHAIFGSPLCFGLCFAGQIYSMNTSIGLFSNKQYSLFPGSGSSTTNKNNHSFEDSKPIHIAADADQTPLSSSASVSRGHGIFSWVPDWIYNRTASLSIPWLPSVSPSSSQQYSLIPDGIIRIPSFVG